MAARSIGGSAGSMALKGAKVAGPYGALAGAAIGGMYGMTRMPTTYSNPGSLSPGTGSAFQDFFYTKLYNQGKNDGSLSPSFQYGAQLPGQSDPNNPYKLAPNNAFNVNNSSSGFGNSNIDYDSIRERAIAPTRGVYMNAMRDLRRGSNMGITNPGYGAQLNALNRGMSQSFSDNAASAEAEISELKLKERALAQENALRSRSLDISERAAPSSLDKGVNTTSNILGLIGQGAGMYGTIMDAYGGGSSGDSINDTIDRLQRR